MRTRRISCKLMAPLGFCKNGDSMAIREFTFNTKGCGRHIRTYWGGTSARNTDSMHTVLKVTLNTKEPEVYVIDLTAAQMGWDDGTMPWPDYKNQRVVVNAKGQEVGSEETELGGMRDYFLKKDKLSSRDESDRAANDFSKRCSDAYHKGLVSWAHQAEGVSIPGDDDLLSKEALAVLSKAVATMLTRPAADARYGEDVMVAHAKRCLQDNLLLIQKDWASAWLM